MNPTRILQYDLPLEKEASCNVRLDNSSLFCSISDGILDTKYDSI
jgi:hypothetical protein